MRRSASKDRTNGPLPHGGRRLARSLDLLRNVNGWRLSSARHGPNGYASELLTREARLAEHDADARANVDPRQMQLFPGWSRGSA